MMTIDNFVKNKQVETSYVQQYLPTSPDVTTKIEDVPQKKIRLSGSNNDLKSLLASSTKGKVILANYSKQRSLSEKDRALLAEVVINKELSYDVNKNISRPRFVEIAQSIVDVFPTERKEVWIAVQYFPNGKTTAKGKLLTKYYNTRRQLTKCGLIKKMKDIVIETSTIEDTEYEEDANELVLWLNNGTGPVETVKEFWEKTTNTRMKYLLDSDAKIDEYTLKFPALKEPYGYTLLEIDFGNLYPDSSFKLLEEWPKFFKFISSKLKIQDLAALNKINSEDAKTVAALMAFCKLFPPVTAIRMKSGQHWRPSRAESQEAFLLHIKTISDLEPLLIARRDKLLQYGLTVQPVAVIVGTSESITSCFVIIDSIKYEVDTPLKAIDVTFKSYHSLNASYPAEAQQIWLFLQQAVYVIFTKFDKPFSTVNSLLCDYRNFNM